MTMIPKHKDCPYHNVCKECLIPFNQIGYFNCAYIRTIQCVRSICGVSNNYTNKKQIIHIPFTCDFNIPIRKWNKKHKRYDTVWKMHKK